MTESELKQAAVEGAMDSIREASSVIDRLVALSKAQGIRIKALQEALREAIGVLDGFGIDGEGLPRLRAILEDSEK